MSREALEVGTFTWARDQRLYEPDLHCSAANWKGCSVPQEVFAQRFHEQANNEGFAVIVRSIDLGLLQGCSNGINESGRRTGVTPLDRRCRASAWVSRTPSTDRTGVRAGPQRTTEGEASRHELPAETKNTALGVTGDFRGSPEWDEAPPSPLSDPSLSPMTERNLPH
jgi:hypothetical protein